MYFDTHAHYDDKRFDADRDLILKELPQKGVSLIVNAASDMESIKTSMALARSYDHVYAACGVHPHSAASMKDSDLDIIARTLEDPKVVALGEIGLDYHYDFSPREIQLSRFEQQLALAYELKVPVVIHNREAHSDTLDTLKKFPGLRGVLHCFSGSRELGEILIKMGFYLSFNGVVTFNNAKRSHEVIKAMPLERLLIETDCPYLAPVPNRGKRNDSSNLVFIAEKIGSLLGLTGEETAGITMKNGREFFGLKPGQG
jgi:TatD DNase family protein